MNCQLNPYKKHQKKCRFV